MSLCVSQDIESMSRNGLARVLRLNKTGMPTAWLSREAAATVYAKGMVVWTLGDTPIVMRGGINRLGERSRLEMAPIIACDGDIHDSGFEPGLENRLLFRRDQHICMYCGDEFPEELLSRDHIVPVSRGGKNRWANVVTACKRCNHHKGNRTPEEAGMELMAVPFRPNLFEFMYLANRCILGDQMEYLKARFSGRRQWDLAA